MKFRKTIKTNFLISFSAFSHTHTTYTHSHKNCSGALDKVSYSQQLFESNDFKSFVRAVVHLLSVAFHKIK
jgi:hypothetical protein